jgi:sulfotransferase family protein
MTFWTSARVTSANPKSEPRFIAFVLSDVRSGSTLLDQLMGAHPCILSVGELHWLAAYVTRDRRQYDPDHELVCTCGHAVTECPFWTRVAGKLERPLDSLRLRPAFSPISKRLVERYPSIFRYRMAQTFLAGPNMVADSLALTDRLFEVSGRRHLVDSSKSVFRFRAIYHARPSHVRGIVLTRDYRAVVHSKMKRGETLKAAAIGWRNRMRQIATLTDDLPGSHVHHVTYEGLCRDPAAELLRLCQFLGEQFDPIMLERPRSGLHHIGGSPSKFDPARTKIKLDVGYLAAFTTPQLATLGRVVGNIPKRWGY